MKKLIALSIYAITFLTAVPTFAQGTQTTEVQTNYYENIEIIVDNDYERIVKEKTDNFIYINTLQKDKNILKTETFNLNNEKIDETIINLNEIIKDINNDYINNYDEIALYSSHYQNTFSNYEYKRIGSSYKLRNKSNYVTKSISSNREAIEKYIDAVDNLDIAEKGIIIASGSAAIYLIYTYLSAGLTAPQVATAVGVAVGDIITYNSAVNKCKSVWNLYIQ